MKKRINRLLSILLVATLCLGLGSVLKLDLQGKAEENISGTYQGFEYYVTDWGTAIAQGKEYHDYHLSINKYTGNAAEVNIPSKIKGYTVTDIYFNAFENNNTLKSVRIPKTVEHIWDGAFEGCSNLETVIIEDGSEMFAIGYGAFRGCSKLNSISIPKSTTEIGNTAFDNSGLSVIYGYTGSEAERFAKENAIQFIPIQEALNGVVKGPDGKWAMYNANQVDTAYTGVAKNNYGWWRVKNGYVDFKANGIYQNAYGWWKTTDGKVTFDENGVFKNDYGWWKVKKSKVDFGYTGVAKNQYGWWRIEKGKVNFKFNGIAKNEYGTWYLQKGKVNFKYSGKVKYNGKTYRVTEGKAKLV